MGNRWFLAVILGAIGSGWLGGCAAAPELRPVLRANGGAITNRAGLAYDSGKKAFAAGDYAKAASDFATAVRLAGNDVAALNGLAASYDQLGRFDLADRYYEQSLMLDSRDSASLNNLGYSLLMRGHTAEAAFMLERARQTAPNDGVVAGNLCRAKLLMGRPRAGAAAEPSGPAEPHLERLGFSLYQWSDAPAGNFPVALAASPSPSAGSRESAAAAGCRASPRQDAGPQPLPSRPSDER